MPKRSRATCLALTALSALALTMALGSVAVAQTPTVVCGRILGFNAATTSAPGAFVIVKTGDVAPNGTYIALLPGTQFSPPTGWVCVQTVPGGPSVLVPGAPGPTTQTFVSFAAPGSPGFQPEPTAPPRPTASSARPVGSLPSTTTDPGEPWSAGALLLVAFAASITAVVRSARPHV